MKQHIGIYSGSFDPIHKGHLAFANETLISCRLDEVIFLPEESPRNKPNITNINDRIDLITHAVATHPKFSIIQLPSSQFTVSATLPLLRNMFIGAEFTFLVGSDIIQKLSLWPNLDTLLQSASLAVGMRSGAKTQDIKSALATIEKQYNLTINYTLVYTDHSHLASSHLRKSKVN